MCEGFLEEHGAHFVLLLHKLHDFKGQLGNIEIVSIIEQEASPDPISDHDFVGNLTAHSKLGVTYALALAYFVALLLLVRQGLLHQLVDDLVEVSLPFAEVRAIPGGQRVTHTEGDGR